MANEISVTTGLRVLNGSSRFKAEARTTSLTQTGVGGPTPGFITVGTTEESTTFPELTTEGMLYMENLDPTNYVQWGFSPTVYGGRMQPNDPPVQMRMEPGLTLYLKADTAACKCNVYGFEK
jgi:hypothetical protein